MIKDLPFGPPTHWGHPSATEPHPKFTRFLPWNGGVTVGRVQQAQALLGGKTSRALPLLHRIVYVGNYPDRRSPALRVDDGGGSMSPMTFYVAGESGKLADLGQFWQRVSYRGSILRAFEEDGVARAVYPRRAYLDRGIEFAVLYELLSGGLP